MGIYTFLDLLLLLIHLEVLLFLTIIFCFGNCSLHFFFLLKSNISDSGLGGSTQLQLQEVPRSCESCHGKKHKGYCGFQLNFSYHTLAEFCPVTAVCQSLVYTDRIY